MLGVLVVVLGGDVVAGGGVARKLQIFLGDVVGGSADFHLRAVRTRKPASADCGGDRRRHRPSCGDFCCGYVPACACSDRFSWFACRPLLNPAVIRRRFVTQLPADSIPPSRVAAPIQPRRSPLHGPDIRSFAI